MSELKYCQGPLCHTHKTKDRIRGPKGDKNYETRKRSHLLWDLFCSMKCERDWMDKFGAQAVDHFGRIHEAKITTADSAWYKDYIWRTTETTGQSRYNHYFVNDLLGKRIPITEQQYDDKNLRRPTATS